MSAKPSVGAISRSAIISRIFWQGRIPVYTGDRLGASSGGFTSAMRRVELRLRRGDRVRFRRELADVQLEFLLAAAPALGLHGQKAERRCEPESHHAIGVRTVAAIDDRVVAPERGFEGHVALASVVVLGGLGFVEEQE